MKHIQGKLNTRLFSVNEANSGYFHIQSILFVKQKNSRALLFTWVILALSLITFPTTSYANEGDDLVQAAQTGNILKVHSLLKKGVNINQIGSKGKTPLMASSGEGHMEVVKVLLDNGAKVNLRPKKRLHILDAGIIERAYGDRRCSASQGGRS